MRLRSTLGRAGLLIALLTTLLVPRTQAAVIVDKGAPFGIAANLGNRVRSDEQPAMVALMQEAGVQWAREEISWDRVQLERDGPFRWNGDQAGMYNYDLSIDLQRQAGINLLGLLAYNPAWFKSKNPTIDEWIDDWGDYVYAVVARYGRDRKQIRYWEVWNEPNLRRFGYEHGLYTIDDFVRILTVARAAIKAADPEAIVVLGGLYDIWGSIPTPQDYDSLDYLRMIHAAGGWHTFDILGLHPYRPGPPEAVLHRRGPDMSFADELRTLDALMAEFGTKPVWLTEVGWSSFTGIFGVTEAEQAAYLQRVYIQALAHPSIEKIFWYDLRDDTSPDAGYDQPIFDQFEEQFHYGLLRRSFPLHITDATLRKPAYLAYRTLTDALDGMRLETILAEGRDPDMPGIFWYRFRDGARRADIIWQVKHEPVEMSVPCSCEEARIRSWDGRLRKVVRTETGQISGRIQPGGIPIIVESGPDKVQQGRPYAVTGHYLGGTFARFWETGGGLAQFGYPITGELIEPDARTGQARVVQYFERARFEQFPEFGNGRYAVQLGRLGDIALQRAGTVWEALPRHQKSDAGCRFFQETGKQVCPPFLDWWEQNGALQRHGLPLTDSQNQGGGVVQYFERSRLEWHPQEAPASRLQLGLIGSDLYRSWDRWE